jgi:hypothetical protein
MSAYRKCRRCGHDLRPNGSAPADHPGTLSHKARQLCSGCYKADCNYGFVDPKAARASLDATRASLAAYLEWRSPFRAKAAGDMT